MSATYDPNLSTDMDWVRFLCGDRDTDTAQISDEEIHALLDEYPNKYCAAASACEIILSKSGGMIDKQVGDLRLKWSDEPRSAYNEYIQGLRARCAAAQDQPNYMFKVLGSRCCTRRNSY